MMFMVVEVLFICVSEWLSCCSGKRCGFGKVEVKGSIDVWWLVWSILKI